MTDYAHTRHAERNRVQKASALADAAVALGHRPYDLRVVRTDDPIWPTVADRDRRLAVRRAAGMRRSASVETWIAALELLDARERETASRTRGSDCPRCGYVVMPVRSASGERTFYLDPHPHPAGRARLEERGGILVAHMIAGHEIPPEDAPLYRQHLASCPRSPDAPARRWAEAPRCPVCREPMDGGLYLADPTYRSHPCCDPRGEVRPRGRGT